MTGSARVHTHHRRAYSGHMGFSRLFPNRPGHQSTEADTVVVIDVLRSFTTAAVALHRGAAAVYPVDDPAAAREACGRIDRAVSVGAFAGGAPVPGFDFGNSPSALARADLTGRPVVISTAAGVRGLHQQVFLLGAGADGQAVLPRGMGGRHDGDPVGGRCPDCIPDGCTRQFRSCVFEHAVAARVISRTPDVYSLKTPGSLG